MVSTIPPCSQENPSYSFGYGVADTHTGDIKTVWEAKEGDTVKGNFLRILTENQPDLLKIFPIEFI